MRTKAQALKRGMQALILLARFYNRLTPLVVFCMPKHTRMLLSFEDPLHFFLLATYIAAQCSSLTAFTAALP